MAKEKRNIKVKAKVNLKYDKDVIKIGEEFLIRESDVKDIKDYIEILTKIEPTKPPTEPPNENSNGNNDDGDNEE